MNVAIKATQTKSKASVAYSIYREVMADASVEEKSKSSTIKSRFKSELGMTVNGANSYFTMMKKRASGQDMYAGHKAANKARALRLKQEQKPTVDLSKRWLVGSSREDLIGSYDTRAQAQQAAKTSNMKWFDGSK